MDYEAKKFIFKGLRGISDEMIGQHYEILYTGYVNKLNEIRGRARNLSGEDTAKANQIFSDLRALKAEESFALNGVLLHELYFENLGRGNGKGATPSEGMSARIAKDFGTFDGWAEEFMASGMAARGWVILAVDPLSGMLGNFCLDSHNAGVPIMTTPILVMDVYEHAYAMDYGAKRHPYLEAFMSNIDWEVCEDRLISVSISAPKTVRG